MIKGFKIFLCALMLYMAMVVAPIQHKQRVEAALPIAAWALAVLGNIVLDMAIDMGIEFVDDVAKTKWKDKKVGEIWNKYGEKIKDLKPTKKNLGKWIFNAPKWLMAAIVDMIGDDIEDIIEKDKKKKEENKKTITTKLEIPDSTDPLYNTGISMTLNTLYSDRPASVKGYAYVTEYAKMTITPKTYQQKSEFTVCVMNDCNTHLLDGGNDYFMNIGEYNYVGAGVEYKIYSKQKNSYVVEKVGQFIKGQPVFEKALKLIEEQNKKIYEADGVITTDGNGTYFDIPDTDDDGKQIVYSPDVLDKLDSSKYPMIKEKEFEFDFGDDSTVIDADYEIINEGDEVSWEIIEKDITNNSDNYNKVINYDYEPTINNYYEVSDPDDLKNDIQIIINNEVSVGDKDKESGSWSGEIEIEGPFYCVDKESKLPISCKEVEAIDGSLLDFAKNSYEYATSTIKTGVDGLKSLGESAVALTGLYELFFGWLPREIRTLMVGGFSVVVGIGIFRAFRK